MATVDIVVPVKNGARYLAAALDSVAIQSFKDWRLLILDHGSTDGTVDIAEQFCTRDARFRLYSFPEARGLSALRNRGLELCDANYMMILDADDVCHPQRIDIMLDAFRVHHGCIALGGQGDRINGDGMHTGDILAPTESSRLAATSFFRNPFLHPSMVMDFPEMMKLGARYGVDFMGVLPSSERLAVNDLAQDYFLLGQLAIIGKCANVPQKVVRYRWHTTNVSVTRFAEQMNVSLKISRYLALNFCRMHDLPLFDPAPFCNHAHMLFNLADQPNFDEEFRHMSAILEKGLGVSEELERELRYRWVLSDRTVARMLWRYGWFHMRHAPEAAEWGAVRAWLLRRFPGKNKTKRSMNVLRDAVAC